MIDLLLFLKNNGGWFIALLIFIIGTIKQIRFYGFEALKNFDKDFEICDSSFRTLESKQKKIITSKSSKYKKRTELDKINDEIQESSRKYYNLFERLSTMFHDGVINFNHIYYYRFELAKQYKNFRLYSSEDVNNYHEFSLLGNFMEYYNGSNWIIRQLLRIEYFFIILIDKFKR
jgi:hypothetical protein